MSRKRIVWPSHYPEVVISREPIADGESKPRSGVFDYSCFRPEIMRSAVEEAQTLVGSSLMPEPDWTARWPASCIGGMLRTLATPRGQRQRDWVGHWEPTLGSRYRIAMMLALPLPCTSDDCDVLAAAFGVDGSVLWEATKEYSRRVGSRVTQATEG